MRKITSDYRESLSDAIIESVTFPKDDSGELEVLLTLWNEEPARMVFSNIIEATPNASEEIQGNILEYLNTSSDDASLVDSPCGKEKSFALVDPKDNVLLSVKAEEVTFYTDSPNIN